MQAWERDPDMGTILTQHHVLLDLICPHCHKKNLLAVAPAPGPSSFGLREVQCAHGNEAWEPLLPGPIKAGPFPK